MIQEYLFYDRAIEKTLSTYGYDINSLVLYTDDFGKECFYDCYLHKELTSEILAPTIESVVGAKIDLSEYKLSRIIFKLAVEISSLMNILAGAFELDDQKVRKMKHRVINEVKELNG